VGEAVGDMPRHHRFRPPPRLPPPPIAHVPDVVPLAEAVRVRERICGRLSVTARDTDAVESSLAVHPETVVDAVSVNVRHDSRSGSLTNLGGHKVHTRGTPIVTNRDVGHGEQIGEPVTVKSEKLRLVGSVADPAAQSEHAVDAGSGEKRPRGQDKHVVWPSIG
jgi:hypothetical protein